MSDKPKKRAKRGFIVHVSAERPLRHRLRALIYEFLLIRPPASAVFFRAPHAFSSLPATSRKPANFQPKPVYFRPDPHCFSSSLAHPSQPPAARKAATALSPLAPHTRVTRTPPFSTFAFTPSPHPENSLMHSGLRMKASPPFSFTLCFTHRTARPVATTVGERSRKR